MKSIPDPDKQDSSPKAYIFWLVIPSISAVLGGFFSWFSPVFCNIIGAILLAAAGVLAAKGKYVRNSRTADALLTSEAMLILGGIMIVVGTVTGTNWSDMNCLGTKPPLCSFVQDKE